MTLEPGLDVSACDRDLDEELGRILVRTEENIEARWRSPGANVFVSLAATLLAVAPHLPGASYVLGNVTGSQAAGVAAAVWLLFELATVSFHALGPKAPISVALAGIDSLSRYAAFLVLIYLSGSASSPLWLVGMVTAFASVATTRGRVKHDRAQILGTYIALAAAFLWEGHVGDAFLTLLVLLAATLAHTMSVRMVARTARVRAERDVLERRLHDATLQRDRERMARELHDGLGADVMALVLRLRRAAETGANPKAAHLATRARGLLDELRGLVWSLRNEQGTLAELGKLIDATCRSVCGEIAYTRTTPLASAQERIGPRAALAAVNGARDLARAAATRPGVTRVHLTLSVADTLELTFDHDGAPSETEWHAAIPLDRSPPLVARLPATEGEHAT